MLPQSFASFRNISTELRNISTELRHNPTELRNISTELRRKYIAKQNSTVYIHYTIKVVRRTLVCRKKEQVKTCSTI